jgi:hypothetical protein
MQVAGVGEHHVGQAGGAGQRELVAGGRDHRAQVPQVGRIDVDLGRDDDLILGADRLGVVALHSTARSLHIARVQITEVDLPAGSAGGENGFGGRPNFLPLLSTP